MFLLGVKAWDSLYTVLFVNRKKKVYEIVVI